MLSRKLIYICLIILFSASFNAFAKNLDVNLSKEHGTQLKSANFPIRYKFEKETKHSWLESTYAQREAFLTDWYTQKAANDLKDYNEKKEELKLQKNKLKENRKIIQSNKNKIKEEKKVIKSNLKIEANEKKEFKKRIKEEKDYIKKLRQQQSKRRKSRKSGS